MSAHYSFWWVNHKQTFDAEVEGGYIWSPKKNKNGHSNQTYENLTRVKRGDVVISYADQIIQAIGIATAIAIEQGKPKEFGHIVGENWSEHEGWLVSVEWTMLPHPLSPKSHIEQIAPLLPSKYSPLKANGKGNQGCYLAGISNELGERIVSLAGHKAVEAIDRGQELSEQLEDGLVEKTIRDSDRNLTEVEQLIRARQGQGVFRQRVMAVEARCRVTGVADERFLIASHIKPWRKSDPQERLDGENGLMLAPHIDKLFDNGWVSFTDGGDLLVTDEAVAVLEAWSVSLALNVGPFTAKQCRYLSYHRQQVFRGVVP